MQEFKFNVTGTDRKRLAGAISEILNTPMKYLGAPTFAYEVGSYSIDKNGTVIGEHDLNLFVGLAGRGFEPEQNYIEEAPAAEETTVTEEIPENEAPDTPAAEEITADTASETTRLVIEYPLDGFTPEAIDNLTKMVLAKEALLKKALGAEELPIQIPDDQSIAFPWFSIDTEGETANAYAQFIAALCKTAKEKKRVTAKAPEAFENEKFAMRVWLIGLGLIGAEFGAARKLLMRNLGGDSGWRYGKPEKAAPAAEESPAEGENAGEVADHE